MAWRLGEKLIIEEGLSLEEFMGYVRNGLQPHDENFIPLIYPEIQKAWDRQVILDHDIPMIEKYLLILKLIVLENYVLGTTM